MMKGGDQQMNLTEQEKYIRVNDISRRFMCVADPEIKKLSLSYNAAVSDEARALQKEAIIVDGLTDNLEDYNWHLEESGASALNLTVPGTKDAAGNAMRTIIDYFSVINDFSDKLMHVRTVDDIYKAKAEGQGGCDLWSPELRVCRSQLPGRLCGGICQHRPADHADCL